MSMEAVPMTNDLVPEYNSEEKKDNEIIPGFRIYTPPTEMVPEVFSTTYVSDIFDTETIAYINSIFKGQKIRVSITVEKL